MNEIQAWCTKALEELAVIDLRLSLEVDHARAELGEFARACWTTVERDILHRPD